MKKKILIHACCAHCLAYVHDTLKDKFKITVFESNPNTHPKKEYKMRQNALIEFCSIKNIELILDDYNDQAWFKKQNKNKIKDNKEQRCKTCYELRLENTTNKAKELGIDLITTTLLYSIYQYHEVLKNLGNKLSKKNDLAFYYEDFRIGWQKGFDLYKPLGLYLQNYCGCVNSEHERFKNK